MPMRAPIAKHPGQRDNNRERLHRRRSSPIGRLYDTAAWERTRMAVLARDPLCKIAKLCGGNALSTEVDHVIKAAKYVAMNGGDLRAFYDLLNLSGACARCHSQKTRRGQ
jgi:5-methylcytosine-specific restriction endonuclease McrA